MVESIKELREICKKGEKETGLPLFYRRISFYFIKVLLYTSISANQASCLAMVTGFIAGIFFVFANPWYLLIGAVMLHLWYIGDYCDGSIARYRHTTGGIGGFLDTLNISSVPYIIFMCISVGVYHQFHDFRAFIFGFSAIFFRFINSNFVKGLIHAILLEDKSIIFKKIKYSLSPSLSRLMNKIIINLNMIFYSINGKDSSTVFKGGISRRSNEVEISKQVNIEKKGILPSIIEGIHSHLQKVLASILFPLYITIAAFGNMIMHLFGFQLKIWTFDLNCMYLILIYFGIVYPLFWVTRICISKQNTFGRW